MKKLLLLCVLLLPGASAYSELHKRVMFDGSGSDRVWPVLPAVKGWRQDERASLDNNVNAQVPEGFHFGNAATVIYAAALNKHHRPGTRSLAQYIEQDKKKFGGKPGVRVKETAPVLTGDGVKLRSFTFFPKDNGEWERVSYWEEGDYYVAITLSSLSREGYEKALPDYLRFVGGYKAKKS